MIHLWALLVKLNNFTFGNKAVLCPQPQARIEAGAWAELGNNRGLNSLLADKVRATIRLWVLLVKLNNFTFGIKAVFCLESTILDGLCWPAWRSCKYNHLSPQLGLMLGFGLSLAIIGSGKLQRLGFGTFVGNINVER